MRSIGNSSETTANDIFVISVFNLNNKLQITVNAVDVKNALTVGIGHTLTRQQQI